MAQKTLDETLIFDFEKDYLPGIKLGVSRIRKGKKQVDEDTGFKLAQALHQIIAEAHQALAVLEEVKRTQAHVLIRGAWTFPSQPSLPPHQDPRAGAQAGVHPAGGSDATVREDG